MPAFLRKYSLSMLSIVTLSAVILPTAIAVLLAHWLVMQRVSESVTRMARQTVARADTVSAEMKQANRLFAQLAGQDPCGTDGIRMMRKAMLHSDTLTDVGHVKDNRLRCSALGHEDQPVGAPTYTSSAGYTIRAGVRLQDAPGITLVVATDPKSGISLFAHSTQILDAIPASEPWDVAVIGEGRDGAVLAARGKVDPEWRKRPRTGQSGIFVLRQHIVAWERSKIAAYTAYVAMPAVMWQAALRRSRACPIFCV